ncbi:hypothetical protein MYX77_09215 [Acidobacteriia bacterium AH_259_A11_L15]|nr:hypothetical protein [Acidobacteriia bacterium AH_259_A11_L15]
MKPKDIEKAISTTEKLLKNVPADKRTLAFPIVLDRVLAAELGSVLEERPRVRTRAKLTAREAAREKGTRPELVRRMVRTGWFKKKRRLSDIAKELRRLGKKTPVTSLPALLLPMVLEGGLEREQDAKGIYVYFSK